MDFFLMGTGYTDRLARLRIGFCYCVTTSIAFVEDGFILLHIDTYTLSREYHCKVTMESN